MMQCFPFPRRIIIYLCSMWLLAEKKARSSVFQSRELTAVRFQCFRSKSAEK
jgi:hypothetical protein